MHFLKGKEIGRWDDKKRQPPESRIALWSRKNDFEGFNSGRKCKPKVLL